MYGKINRDFSVSILSINYANTKTCLRNNKLYLVCDIFAHQLSNIVTFVTQLLPFQPNKNVSHCTSYCYGVGNAWKCVEVGDNALEWRNNNRDIYSVRDLISTTSSVQQRRK